MTRPFAAADAETRVDSIGLDRPGVFCTLTELMTALAATLAKHGDLPVHVAHHTFAPHPFTSLDGVADGDVVGVRVERLPGDDAPRVLIEWAI